MLFLLLDHFFNSFCQKQQKKEDEPKKIKKTAAHLLALKRKTKIPIPKLFPPPKKKRHAPTLPTNPAKVGNSTKKRPQVLRWKVQGIQLPWERYHKCNEVSMIRRYHELSGFGGRNLREARRPQTKMDQPWVICGCFFPFFSATFWEFLAAKKQIFADVGFAHLFWSSYGWDWIWCWNKNPSILWAKRALSFWLERCNRLLEIFWLRNLGQEISVHHEVF